MNINKQKYIELFCTSTPSDEIEPFYLQSASRDILSRTTRREEFRPNLFIEN